MAVSKKQFVADLSHKDSVDSVFLLTEKRQLTDKNGKGYLNLNLSDVTGSVNAKMWGKLELFSDNIFAGDFVHISGSVQTFQNRTQIIVTRGEKAEISSADLAHFVKSSERPASEILADIEAIVDSLENTYLRRLLQETFEDKNIREKLLIAPAAKSIHHAYSGGLIEHVLSICKIMNFLASHYEGVNRDLMIFGAIYHDIGKVWELEYSPGIKYTDRGRLVGHMAMGCELLEKQCAKILGFPTELKDQCTHIILSHHNKLEYGSPKRPKTLEALLVAMVDELDSRVNTVSEYMKNERKSGDTWSQYNTHFDRYFYLGPDSKG